MALVTFANGAAATVVNSVVSPREVSTLRFDYERATVEVDHLYGYTDADWTVTPAPTHDDILPLWQKDNSDVLSGHGCQIEALYDALDRNEAPPVTLADARNTMEFIAALYASAFTATPIRRGQIQPGNPFYTSMEGTGAPWR
jgi:predicted dehydrogenase